jgi:hypothetical protein
MLLDLPNLVSNTLHSVIAVVDLITFCTMNNLIHLGFNFVLGKCESSKILIHVPQLKISRLLASVYQRTSLIFM